MPRWNERLAIPVGGKARLTSRNRLLGDDPILRAGPGCRRPAQAQMRAGRFVAPTAAALIFGRAGAERPLESAGRECTRVAEEQFMAEKDPGESGRRLHVTTLLVASRRALNNALAELGFAEDDDRVVEHDGRLAFLTCSHEEDSDDLFALVTELSARGESWELQSRIDTEPGHAIYQSLSRYRPVEAVDAPVDEEQEPESPEAPVYDIETPEGLAALKRALKRVEPADAFATIRPGRDGRATARVLRRGSRRLVAAAVAADEATLRGVIREVLPNVMLDVAMKPPA
jgi:hypothetical protein